MVELALALRWLHVTAAVLTVGGAAMIALVGAPGAHGRAWLAAARGSGA